MTARSTSCAAPAGAYMPSLAAAASRAAVELISTVTATVHPVELRWLALQGLREAGISVPEWAEANGFHVQTVKGVLYGHLSGKRGEAYRAAVALGIKEGRVINAQGFRPVLAMRGGSK